jgi:hypothetical protein
MTSNSTVVIFARKTRDHLSGMRSWKRTERAQRLHALTLAPILRQTLPGERADVKWIQMKHF